MHTLNIVVLLHLYFYYVFNMYGSISVVQIFFKIKSREGFYIPYFPVLYQILWFYIQFHYKTEIKKRSEFLRGFPDSSVGKESACNPGDPGLTSEFPRGEHSFTSDRQGLWFSCRLQGGRSSLSFLSEAETACGFQTLEVRSESGPNALLCFKYCLITCSI